MEIKINNEPLQLENEASVVALLKQIESRTTGIAVAINNHVVPKKNWETTQLKQNDSVVIIEATQGG